MSGKITIKIIISDKKTVKAEVGVPSEMPSGKLDGKSRGRSTIRNAIGKIRW